MGRPQRISDAQIDEAARQTFLAHGSQAPVALVAQQLGVSHAALLQRAGSKEQLLMRALCSKPPAALQLLAEAPPAKGRRRRLAELLEGLRVFHERMLPGLMILKAGGLQTSPPDGVRAPTVELRRLLTRWLFLATRVSRRRAAAKAEGLLGAIEARCFNAYLGGPGFVEGADADFVPELIMGLVPELKDREETTP